MFSKVFHYARKPITIAFLISLVVSSRRYIDRYDGAPTLGFWFAAIIRLAVVTLLVYASLIVIDKVFDDAGVLFKRLFRNGTPKM